MECEVRSDLLAPGRKFFTLHFSLFTFHSSLNVCKGTTICVYYKISAPVFTDFHNSHFTLLQCMIHPDVKFKLCTAKYHIRGFKQNMYLSTPQTHHVGAPQRAGDGRHAPRADGRYDLHARRGKEKKFTMCRCGCVNVHLFICSFLPISDSEGIKILIIYILLIKKI